MQDLTHRLSGKQKKTHSSGVMSTQDTIVLQKAVEVKEDDTPESLHARIQVQEHIAYPEALRIIAAGSYQIEGRRVHITPQ